MISPLVLLFLLATYSMVMSKAWLSDLRSRVSPGSAGRGGPVLGILAFEAAAAMSRLVSLHRSLADHEVLKLRSETMRSPGVAYLTSTDQALLLRLAAAELVCDLDRAAAAVARLGARCREALPHGFDHVYADLKAGGLAGADIHRLGLHPMAKKAEKRVRKMERYVSLTSRLYAEMEILAEMEASERKMEQQCRRFSGPIPMQKPAASPDPAQTELRYQRQRVRRLREESLWSQTYDKAVELMARAVITIFATICDTFGQFVPGLPHLDHQAVRSSGPLERPAVKQRAITNSAPILRTKETAGRNPCEDLSKLLEPGPNTAGGSGLVLRYANVIVSAENVLFMRSEAAGVGDAVAREELYEMLPAAMRAAVRAKLRECYRAEGAVVDGSLADGWREVVERILGWLGPVARDTVRWHDGRNMDRRRRFDTQPRALKLQTLHFADREKTEAAIVEVLVGLSCMCWYEERRLLSMRY